MAKTLWVAVALLVSLWTPTADAVDPVRVKDLGRLQGWRENALVGHGIVTGLAGTGDSPGNRTTRQMLANVMSQFNVTVVADQIQSRNVAVVMVSASLPPFAREGDTLDITVTSAGDARSLLGGSLLLTPLKAANGKVYALAQGPLTVGGYRYDANGNVVQKNHPTVGSVPNGATVEVGVVAPAAPAEQRLTFVLSDPDYTTAERIAQAVNSQFGQEIASARDASGVEVIVPASRQGRLVGFIAALENIKVQPDQRSRVIVNERTGTVVAGGDIRLAKVTISYGDIKISVESWNAASQPQNVWVKGGDVRTEIVTNTRVDVTETDSASGAVFFSGGGTVADLVQSLSQMKISARDIISILRAVKAAGALHAELIVQ